MSGAPISAPEAEFALLEAARAFEGGQQDLAAALWLERALPAVRVEWAAPLAHALASGIELVLQVSEGAAATEPGGDAVRAWDEVERWLPAAELPLAGGRSTPAHFRKHRQDPAVYRTVGLAEHLKLAGAGRAVALNNRGVGLAAIARNEEARALLHAAASLRRAAFGWREAGLDAILANAAAVDGVERAPLPGDPVPVGPDRFLALAAGQSELRRQLLAAAELVPILRAPAG
jgi:hypothetical protein